MEFHELKKFRALPVQLIDDNDGIVLKRGCTELKIIGEGAGDAVRTVLSILFNGGATSDEIANHFAGPDRDTIRQLLDQLIAKRLVVIADSNDTFDESSLDIFYWHFGTTEANMTNHLKTHEIAIVGVNKIARRLAKSLLGSGFNITVIDDPLLRNLRMFREDGDLIPDKWDDALPLPQNLNQWHEGNGHENSDCVIATSDIGNVDRIRHWNQFSVHRNKHFCSVFLKDVIGYVGPLVIPGETACFECLRQRQNSQLAAPNARTGIEALAYEGQGIVGFHPAMATTVADLTALELTKFYSRVMPTWNIGTLIEVNLLVPQVFTRRILKIPRCLVCSSMLKHSSITPYKQVFNLPEQAQK
jgi:thiazole/oxazole-forming peptide maturase SagC family component